MKKTIFIGLDAAEPALVEKWMAAGRLPNLQKLREQGSYGRIGNSGDHLVGLPWPTFYTGKNPGHHGAYHYLQWDPGKMASRRISRDWLPLAPFWQAFTENDSRAVVVDVPLTPGPRPFNGIEINGWGSHEVLVPLAAYPENVLAWIERHIGPSPSFDERYGRFSETELDRIRDRLIFLTRQVARLCCTLIEKEPWDLFMTVFSATHRAGHQLWRPDDTSAGTGRDETTRFSALQSVYAACDKAVGDIIDHAGNDMSVFVCSLHGMGFNQSRTEILNELVAKITSHESGHTTSQRPGVLSRIREMVPETFRHFIKRHMPHQLQDALTSFWRMGGADWANSPVITLLGDYDGYLQVNLKGREAEGIVAPGKEYDDWVEKIITGLTSFTDADSGEPVVKQVLRREDLGLYGDCLNRLPDLIVQWALSPAAGHRKISSPTYGTVDWPTPGRNPEGRTGNHRSQGFIFARGKRFSPGTTLDNVHTVDLAPTILNSIGREIPSFMEGKVISNAPATKEDA